MSKGTNEALPVVLQLYKSSKNNGFGVVNIRNRWNQVVAVTIYTWLLLLLLFLLFLLLLTSYG